ncbi:Abi family protein [Corynebacterium mayonis]|uniref:Abi family protein n=1 Tax=Corynebacterium mayonis TaxID=3062461 RepID=UPI003140A5A9
MLSSITTGSPDTGTLCSVDGFVAGQARDKFVNGASIELVVSLYEFDERLRHTVFMELDRIEMAVKTMLGHELGRIDPMIHLNPEQLGPRARQHSKNGH